MAVAFTENYYSFRIPQPKQWLSLGAQSSPSQPVDKIQALGSLISFSEAPSQTAWTSFSIGVVPHCLVNSHPSQATEASRHSPA